MDRNIHLKFPVSAWLSALSNYFDEPITQATKRLKRLQGGTVADVFLVQGIAITSNSGKQPYKIVWKHTRQWNRPGDLLSWRREYDWVQSNEGINLGEHLKIPTCYHKEISETGNDLWMEYVNGVSGNDLTLSMLEEVAFQWGSFQGQFSLDAQPLVGKNLTDLSFLKSELSQWYHNPYAYLFLCSDQSRIPSSIKETLRKNDWNDGFSITYHYIRSIECDLPMHLKQMIIELDESIETKLSRLSKLPLVITHRDFWIENIFYRDGTIHLIDWDCIGTGYFGEDIASLIADDTPTTCLETWIKPLLTSYKKGLFARKDASMLEIRDVAIMILMKYGYRLVDNYWFSDSLDEKKDIVERLSIFHRWLHQ
jgi:hypothetical protein